MSLCVEKKFSKKKKKTLLKYTLYARALPRPGDTNPAGESLGTTPGVGICSQHGVGGRGGTSQLCSGSVEVGRHACFVLILSRHR